MIIEQSFYALPEFLVGSGFVKYESEGTLVMAYAMAMLQELNGRGVSNPIAQIRGEVMYPDVADRSADIHLNYGKIGVLSDPLQKYGVRRDNWLEAKFFRKNDKDEPTLVPLNGSYAVLRDLLRLAALVPEAAPTGDSNSARYFLHVYEGSHEDHLSLGTNIGGGQKRQQKAWLQNIHSQGSNDLPVTDFSIEPEGFDKEVGKPLRPIKFSGVTTTFAVAPTDAPYRLYLTRLDDFSVQLGADLITLKGGKCSESSSGAWARIRSSVAAGLAK